MYKRGVILFPKVTVIKALESEEEIDLIKKAQEGDEDAFFILYEKHQGLIVTEAKRFKNSGLDLVDRIQEGNSGLLQGIQRFDPGKGTKLTTYAVYYIRHNIRQAVMNQRMPRIPTRTWEKIVQVKKAQEILEAEEKLLTIGKEPTIEEISKEVSMSPEKIEKLYLYMEGQKTVFLDEPISKDFESSGAKIVEILDTGEENQEMALQNRLLIKEIDEKIDKLSVCERFKIIFKLRVGLIDLEKAKEEIDKLPVPEDIKRTFKQRIDLLIESNNLVGLNRKECYSLEDIGKIFDLSRERISQIERQIRRKLKIKLSG